MSTLSFIERYYEAVDDNLDDPSSSRRYPKSKRLRDLHDLDQTYFEKLLRISGQESYIGLAEATITLQAGVEFYRLPVGFRNFLTLEFRDTDGEVMDRIGSKGFYNSRLGAQVITSGRGLRITPSILLENDQDWTLVYQRAPGRIHYAKASHVTEQSIITGVPPEDAGEVVLQPDYYNGMDIRVYSAERGAEQAAEVVGSNDVDGKMSLQLRHPFTTAPTGDVWYEVRPCIPDRYDSIYALDAAILQMGRRRLVPAKSLLDHREELWDAVLQHYQSNVSDRAPERIIPERQDLSMLAELPC